jgi:hypothetical protein
MWQLGLGAKGQTKPFDTPDLVKGRVFHRFCTPGPSALGKTIAN